MSAISLKSITGITSITTPAGVDNQLTLHNNNTTEAVKLDIAGNLHINNHLAVAGVTTTQAFQATTGTFTGDVDIASTLCHSGDTDTKITFATNTIKFDTDTEERLRITSTGKVCIAHSDALHSGNLQVSATGADAIDINSYSTNANSGGRLSFYRSKNASIGSNTIVTDDDSLGRIDFRGYNINGNSYDQGATIEARVDGSVNSSTDMPTAILFKTSGDGSANPDERLRIDSSGKLGVGDFSSTSIAQALHVRGSQPEIYLEHTGGYDLTLTTNDGMGQNGITVNGGFLSLAYNNKNIVMCRTGGNVGIVTTSPQAKLELDGRFRILDNSDGTPTSGKGLEISYYTSDDMADILSYDRGAASYKKLQLRGSSIELKKNNSVLCNIGTGGNGVSVGFSTTLNLVTNAEKIAVRGYSSFKSVNPAYAAIYVGSEGNTNDTANQLVMFNNGGANRGGIGYVPNTGELRFNNQYFMTFCTGSQLLNGTERLKIAQDGEVKINGDGSGTGYLRVVKDRDSAYNANGGNGQDLIVQQISDALNTQGYSALALQCNYTGQTGAWVAINAVRTGVGEADLTINPRNNTTGDVERLRITSSGDMGLGTGGNPVTQRLDVRESSTTIFNPASNLPTIARLYNTSAVNGASAGLQLRTDNNNGAAGIQYIHAVNSSTNYSSDLVFSRRLATSGTYAEACRITNAGNLKFPNGKGIDFSATEGNNHTGDSVFDDYEVGNWTPAVTGLSGLIDAQGKYIKVGDQVTLAWYFTIGVKTYASGYASTQSFIITGLPYACEHGSGGPWYGASIGNFRYLDSFSPGNNQFMMNIGDGYSSIHGRRGTFGNNNFSNMQLGDFYNNFAMHGSITYRSA